MSLLVLMFALPLMQEPEAPAPEIPIPTPEQEQEPGPQDPVSMAEVEQAFAAITRQFASLDQLLQDSVDQVAAQAEDPTAAPAEGGGLTEARAAADQLVADMEHLLEILPAPPPPPPNGGGGGSQQSPEQKQPQDQQGEDPSDGDDPRNSQAGSQERPDGNTAPPEAPLRSVLRDPRAGSWGNLPPRLQQAIDNASAEDLPLRYRRWLVEYHRHGRDG